MNWHLLPIGEIEQLLQTTPSGIDAITASERQAVKKPFLFFF